MENERQSSTPGSTLGQALSQTCRNRSGAAQPGHRPGLSNDLAVHLANASGQNQFRYGRDFRTQALALSQLETKDIANRNRSNLALTLVTAGMTWTSD